MSGIEYDSNNVFKKILSGEIFETEHCIAILDAFPSVPGHSLLIPKKETATILDMTDDDAANVLKELPRLARAVKAFTGAAGINILQNSGKAAGQEVFHTHFHVVPRYSADGRFKFNGNTTGKINDEEAQRVLAGIQANL